MDTWCRQRHHQHMLYLIWNSNEPLWFWAIWLDEIYRQSNGSILKTCLIPLLINMVFYENFVLDFLELPRENFRWYISLFHFQFLNRFWSLYTLYQGLANMDRFRSRSAFSKVPSGPSWFKDVHSWSIDGPLRRVGQFESAEPLLFTSFIHFMIFCSKKLPFRTSPVTKTGLRATASTRLACYSIRQSKRRKC